MRRLFVILIVLLASCKEQQKRQPVTVTEKPNPVDSSYWFKETHRFAQKIGLQDIKQQSSNFHFRIWKEYQVFDVYVSDSGTFHGLLSNFTSDSTKFYWENSTISESDAKEVKKLFEQYSIEKIPDQDSIKGWEGGFDAGLYAIECYHNNKYSFKTYGGLFPNNKTKECTMLRSFIMESDNILTAENSFFCFINSLPKGLYSWEGIMGIVPGEKPCRK
jgi:hypothetical protein